jgi:signal peptidase I
MAKEAQTKKTTKKKMTPLSIGITVVQWVLIVALIAFVAASFGTRIPALAKLGLNFFSVSSGSMEPTIPTGSLISVGKYRVEDLKEGDIITYQLSRGQGETPAVVTHRIVKVEKTEDVKEVPNGDKVEQKTVVNYEFTTKGDANTGEDSYKVRTTDLIGLYKGHVPKVGFITSFAQTPRGFVALVIIPAAILILWEVASIVLHFKNHFEKKSAGEVERLKAELAKVKADAKNDE